MTAPPFSDGYVTATGEEIAVQTRLSHSDPRSGRTVVAGADLFAAAARLPYEDVAALLWHEILPGQISRAALGAARAEAFARLVPLFPAAAAAPLSAIARQRLLLAAIPEADLSPVMLVAAVGVAAAAAARIESGAQPLPPDPESGHAADLLRAARGRSADAVEAHGLDVYLGTMIDHGVNASTFAARVVASTGAGRGAAAIAGLCALEGPLHGGAPALVLDMLDAAQAEGDPAVWLAAALARKARLMGFGSRAYGGRDPRADIFKAALLGLPAASRARLPFAERLEREAEALFAARRPDKPMCTNVEFYAALLLDALGLPRAAFTPIFAAARSAGWAAHTAEQARHGRMLRPRTAYCGPGPAQG